MFNFTNNWHTNQQIINSQILTNDWIGLVALHVSKDKCIQALDELGAFEYPSKHILESRLIRALNQIEEEMQYL